MNKTKAEDKLVENMKKSVRFNTQESNGVDGRPVEQFTSKYAQEVHENLHQALRINESTISEGDSALGSLGKQRDTINHSLNEVEATSGNLREAKRVIREIRLAFLKERVIKGMILVMLLLIIGIIIYVKWLHTKS